MSSGRAILLFLSAFILIMGALKVFVKAADAMDEKLAAKTLEEVDKAGYFLLYQEENSHRFRRHLDNWIDHPMRRTRVSYYDVNPRQPNDTLPKFTMTLIEIVFEDQGHADEFVRNFNKSSQELRNGNVAEQCWNIAYVSTRQMRFSDILHRAAYPITTRTDL